MTLWKKSLTRGVVTTGILIGLTAALGASSSLAQTARTIVVLRGEIACVDCSKEDVKNPQPDAGQLFELKHEKGQLVLNKAAVEDEAYGPDTPHNEDQIRNRAGLGEQVFMRGDPQILQQLTSKENLHKEVLIKGILHSDRMLDVGSVQIGEEKFRSGKDKDEEVSASR